MSSVQKRAVLFFYNHCCTWFIKIIEKEGIDFYLLPTQSLLDSRSNPNHIQPMLMYMITSLANSPTFVPIKNWRLGFSIGPTNHFWPY